MHLAPVLQMELADSEIRQLVWQGDNLHIHFSAAAATQAQGAAAPVAGFLSGVVWVLSGCTLASGPDTGFGRIRSGSIRVDGGGAQRQVELPTVLSAPLTLALEWAQGGWARWQAQGLDCRLSEVSEFRESWAC